MQIGELVGAAALEPATPCAQEKGEQSAKLLSRLNYSNYTSCKWFLQMADKVSTIEVRRRIGDMLNRVALRHDEFIIERKGKPLAALVPVERLEQMRRFARRQALDVMEQQKGGTLSDAQAMELGLEAQRWARQQRRESRPKAK